MAKTEVTKIGKLTEGKKEIISKLLDEYDIETAEDIQWALADLLGCTIKKWKPRWMRTLDMKKALGVIIPMPETVIRVKMQETVTASLILKFPKI